MSCSCNYGAVAGNRIRGTFLVAAGAEPIQGNGSAARRPAKCRIVDLQACADDRGPVAGNAGREAKMGARQRFNALNTCAGVPASEIRVLNSSFVKVASDTGATADAGGCPAITAATTGATNLAAGEYYLVGVPPEQADIWQDPAKLASLVGSATRVTLAWGDTKTQNVTVVKIP